MSDSPRPNVLQHMADVVSAHLRHNTVQAEALPQLIQSVYQALSGLGTEVEASTARPEPAVAIRKSVFPDYIVCLEDGAKLKMLKRYIHRRFNLTPVAYRVRWGLPFDYPMVAPNYTRKRLDLTRQTGLGSKTVPEPAVEPTAQVGVEDNVLASKPAKGRAQ